MSRARKEKTLDCRSEIVGRRDGLGDSDREGRGSLVGLLGKRHHGSLRLWGSSGARFAVIPLLGSWMTERGSPSGAGRLWRARLPRKGELLRCARNGSGGHGLQVWQHRTRFARKKVGAAERRKLVYTATVSMGHCDRVKPVS